MDLVAGRYPSFLFGFGLGDLLPVFHFHEATPAVFEPACRYLVENHYQTVTTEELSGLVRDGRTPAPRSVMLAFDDARASLWSVAGPLLKRYGLKAVTYAIPARMRDAERVRPTLDDPAGVGVPGEPDDPFVTWPELKSLSISGLVDVQSHTWSHSMIFSGEQAIDVVRPLEKADDELARPRVNDSDPPAFAGPDRLGFPIFPRQSRMSSARRFFPDDARMSAVETFVATHGGAAFFRSVSWREELQPHLRAITGRWETDAERERAIEHELVAARDTLEARLGTRVRHVCLPWGVTSPLTQALLERLGFKTAFANRLKGVFAVRAGDDPFFLKRLANRHIFALPGRGRRPFFTFA